MRVLAAALAVLSVFLLREPLLLLWRRKVAAGKHGGKAVPLSGELSSQRTSEAAQLSLLVYGLGALLAGAYLLFHLPWVPLLLIACGTVLLAVPLLWLTVRNLQRHPVLQIATAAVLTASSLLAYLAGRGDLEAIAFWIWLLCAAHNAESVLVVHARLEAVVAAKKTNHPPALFPSLRHALLAEAGLGLFLVMMAVQGSPEFVLPFVPPALLHGWELWRLSSGQKSQSSMRRVGWTQLAASAAFCFLLIVILA